MQCSMPKGVLVSGVRQLWPTTHQLISKVRWGQWLVSNGGHGRSPPCKVFASKDLKFFFGTRKYVPSVGDNIRFREWCLGASDSSQTYRTGDSFGRRRVTAPVKADDLEDLKSEPLDAIFVLAGGQLTGGGVPVWVERRLDRALQLQKLNGPNCVIVCLGSGTPYRQPLLTSEGFIIHESSSCVDYLISKGAQLSVLLKEWGSYDTIGNGFFALTQHAIPRRWRRLAVVTSDFHMPRSHAIFEWIFGLQGAGTSILKATRSLDGFVLGSGSQRQGFMLQYHGVSDDGIDFSIIQARIAKEKKGLENLKIVRASIKTLPEFHMWFHTQHKCYNVEHQGLFGKQPLDDPALRSY